MLAAGSKKTILSGIQPTNCLTLGNYLGAVKNWVKIQQDYACYFMAVDQHAITVRQEPQALRDNTWFGIATYMAAGIDPEACTIFAQSQIPQHAQLAWILNCYGYMGELSRMTQFKDKSAKAGSNITVGLFTYPLLMAADILLYDAHLVPVGEDQRQHVELTRDVGQRVNAIYGDDTFVIPEAFIPSVGAKVMDLQNPTAKMSKSASEEGGAIYLSDTPSQIEKKFKRAVTDSATEIIYDPLQKPGVSNMLSIQAALSGESIETVVQRYAGKQYGHLKLETAARVIEELSPIQKRTQELLADKGELSRILRRSGEKAAAKAEATLQRVYDRVGFIKL